MKNEKFSSIEKQMLLLKTITNKFSEFYENYQLSNTIQESIKSQYDLLNTIKKSDDINLYGLTDALSNITNKLSNIISEEKMLIDGVNLNKISNIFESYIANNNAIQNFLYILNSIQKFNKGNIDFDIKPILRNIHINTLYAYKETSSITIPETYEKSPIYDYNNVLTDVINMYVNINDILETVGLHIIKYNKSNNQFLGKIVSPTDNGSEFDDVINLLYKGIYEASNVNGVSMIYFCVKNII